MVGQCKSHNVSAELVASKLPRNCALFDVGSELVFLNSLRTNFVPVSD